MTRTASIADLSAVRDITPSVKHRRYPVYASSGSPWLRDLPSHWKARRLKFVARSQPSNVDKKSADGEIPVRLCNYVDVYKNDYITADLDFMQATADPSELAKFQLRKGDVLITKDSEEWTDIAVPAFVTQDFEDVACGYHLSQVRPRVNAMDGEYLFRAFRATGIAEQFQVRANGITRFGLAAGAIGDVMFPVPPIDEQRAIASFLRCETSRIDALIKMKQRLIELLEEKRTALISRTVTKGLDQCARMKWSGIEWFGDIPQHWKVVRLGWISQEVSDINHEMPLAVDEGVAFLSAKDLLDDGTLNFTDAIKRISEDDFVRLARKSRPRRGDIIYSRIGACLGKARLVETDERFLVSYSCCVIRLDPSIADRRFFRHLLDAEMVLTEAKMRTQGIGVPDLGLREICRFPIPLPPKQEQSEIVQFLDTEVAKLRALSHQIINGIARLHEYRSALISAAITGQIDVRQEVHHE